MIGLDTNVLVRLMVEDDAPQLKRARAALDDASERSERAFVSDIVLAELDWVLDGAYRVPKPRIVAALQALAASEHFEFEDRARVVEAIARYQAGRAELSDYLIGLSGASRGSGTTVTFDRTLRDEELFTLI